VRSPNAPGPDLAADLRAGAAVRSPNAPGSAHRGNEPYSLNASFHA